MPVSHCFDYYGLVVVISKQDTHSSVHCSFTYNRQNMETTQVPINRRGDKKPVVHVYNEYYSAIKMNEILLFVAAWINLEDIMLSEIGQT